MLGNDAVVRQYLGVDGLTRVMAPASYLGVSAAFIDTVLAHFEQWRAKPSEA